MSVVAVAVLSGLYAYRQHRAKNSYEVILEKAAKQRGPKNPYDGRSTRSFFDETVDEQLTPQVTEYAVHDE